MTNATVVRATTIAASLWFAAGASADVVSPQAVGCKLIRNAAQLQAMQNNLAGSYCLANDIDAGSITSFMPIGRANTPFTGKLFGNGRVVRNLTIVSDAANVGLFGVVDGALIQEVGLENIDVSNTSTAASVGGLVGYVLTPGRPTEIRRVHVTGRVAASIYPSFAGGIVGRGGHFILVESWSSARVSGVNVLGGLVGSSFGNTISRSYAAGPVTWWFGRLQRRGFGHAHPRVRAGTRSGE